MKFDSFSYIILKEFLSLSVHEVNNSFDLSKLVCFMAKQHSPKMIAPVITKKSGALLSLHTSPLVFLTPITNKALLNIKPIRQKYFLLLILHGAMKV